MNSVQNSGTDAFKEMVAACQPKLSTNRPAIAWCLRPSLALIVGALFVAQGLMLDANGAADSYQVSGTIREETFFGKRKIVIRSFSCRVEGEAWHIETIITSDNPAEAMKNDRGTHLLKIPDVETACSDGKNFYVVTEARFPAEITHTLKNRGKSQVTGAIIGAGSVPIGLNEPLLAVWYAFASANYLRAQPSGKVIPLHTVAFEDVKAKDYLTEGQWQFLPTPPGLPRTIQTSNYFDLSMPGANDLQKLRFPNTNVDFRVLAWTNSLGLAIPTVVVVDYFFYRMKDGPVGFHNKRLDVVVTETSRPTSETVCPPPLPHGAIVNDTRFWFSNRMAYVSVTSTNGWPKDAQLQAEYRARASRSAHNQLREEKGKVWVRALLVGAVLLSSAALAFFLCRGRATGV